MVQKKVAYRDKKYTIEINIKSIKKTSLNFTTDPYLYLQKTLIAVLGLKWKYAL